MAKERSKRLFKRCTIKNATELIAELTIANKELVIQNEKLVAELIIAKEKVERHEHQLEERIKELKGMYSLGRLIDKFANYDDFANEFVKIIVPQSMQFPEKVFVALEIDNKKYCNIENFNLRRNVKFLSAPINVFGKQTGQLVVAYTEDLPFIDFFEQDLINAYSERISKMRERIKSQEELIRAKEKAEESDRLKSAFLTNMSHEIRTPMNGILGFIELLKEKKFTGDEQQEYINIIEQSSERMLNTINDIINISKVESGQMEVSISETNITEQIKYIYNFFKPEAEQKGLKLFVKNALLEREHIINTDGEKFNVILTHLVNNAIKFTHTGFIEFGYEPKGKHLEFSVKDTGIAIPKDKQEVIFERFVQAHTGNNRAFQGAGLGLSISKAYVEMLGGEIWLESEEGKGSVFYFTIPHNAEPEENIVSADEK